MPTCVAAFHCLTQELLRGIVAIWRDLVPRQPFHYRPTIRILTYWEGSGLPWRKQIEYTFIVNFIATTLNTAELPGKGIGMLWSWAGLVTGKQLL